MKLGGEWEGGSELIYDRVHGFTIRGDQDNEKETKAKEDANNAAMAFVAKAFGN